MGKYAFLNRPDGMRWYQRIQELFHFDPTADVLARDLLVKQRQPFDPDPIIARIHTQCHQKLILSIGSGPSLTALFPDLQTQLQQNRQRYYLMTADGASRPFLEHGILPDLVVTDLDGLVEADFRQLVAAGVPILVHAHGDNRDKLRTFDWMLSSYDNIIGTTQVEPQWPVLNPGGFTDGDRGVYFLHGLLPPAVPFYLLGYDFGDIIGRYSKPNYVQDMPITEMKRKKLVFSEELLDFLKTKEKRNLIFNHWER